jgi:hypothetical protein
MLIYHLFPNDKTEVIYQRAIDFFAGGRVFARRRGKYEFSVHGGCRKTQAYQAAQKAKIKGKVSA